MIILLAIRSELRTVRPTGYNSISLPDYANQDEGYVFSSL